MARNNPEWIDGLPFYTPSYDYGKDRKMKLLKEEFVKYIDRLREASDLQEKVNELFRKSRDNIEWDFLNAASLQISHESSVVSLLEKIMEDDVVYPDISYFIYELDYGRLYKPGCLTDENDEEVDISTAEKLYDWLTRDDVLPFR